jgi:AcrR family transcriptional regulator
MTKTKEEVLREKILTGAARLFQKFGLEKTTIEDIAREAGKGKSTLYYYFRSKEDIFDAIIKEENEQFFAVLQQAVSDAPTAIRKLDIFWRSRLENLKYRANLYNVIVQEGIEALRTGRGGATARHRVQHDNKETSILKSIFQFGIVSGEFRVLSESELDMIAFVFMSSMHGLEMDLVIHERIDEVLQNFDFLQEVVTKGILK